MAYVQQEYEIGQDFGAYRLSDLTADAQAGADWTWDHRTLSGFRKENGEFVPQGGTLNFDTEHAQVSGVWTLDSSEYPLSVFGLGSTGRVAVKVIEYN